MKSHSDKFVLQPYTFESGESSEEFEDFPESEYFQSILVNLIQKLKQVFNSRCKPSFDELKLTFSPNFKPNDTSRFFMKSQSQILTENANCLHYNSFNKVIDPDEHIRILKIEILRSKLLMLTNILKKHVCDNIFKFFERFKLKIEMQNFFNKDDNYLYILPKPKLFRFRTIYAYRRLLYVIKSYKYRINFLMINMFMKWKDMIDDVPNNFLLQNKDDFKIIKFMRILQAKFEKHFNNCNRIKLSFLFMKYKFRKENNFDDNCLNPEIENFENYIRSIYKLINIFQNFRKNIFYEIVGSQFNLIQVEKKKNINTEINKNKQLFNQLLSGILKLQNILIRTKTQNLFIKFSKWKRILFDINYHRENLSSTDIKNLQFQNFSNGLKFILNLFNFKFTAKLYYQKCKFFERIKFIYKLHNTLKDYGRKYKKLPQLLNNDNLFKEKIIIMRQTFNKVFHLKKLFFKINNKQNMLYNSDQYYSNKSNCYVKTYTNNDNTFLALIFCFYRWKNLVFESLQGKFNRSIYISNIAAFLENKFITNYKNEFLLKLFLIANYKKQFENMQKEEYKIKLLKVFITKLNNIYYKNKLILFHRLKSNTIYQNICDRNYAAKFIFFYYKYNFNNTSANNALKTKFSAWKRLCLASKPSKVNHKALKSNLIQRLLKISYLISKKYNRDLQFFFIKFKIKAKSPNKQIFAKSKHVHKIDYFIIENQSKVLLEFEKEDNKLNLEIGKFKNLSKSKGVKLLRWLYLKHIKLLHYYFKQWKSNDNLDSNTKPLNVLLNENEILQNENDSLMEIYREKTKEYKTTINDFEYVKGHFCNDCLGEEFEIDYKSVRNLSVEEKEEEEEEKEIEGESEEVFNVNTHTQFSSMSEENFQLNFKGNETTNLQKVNGDTLTRKVAEMELKIKNLHILFENKVNDYDNQLRVCGDKKNELLLIKEKILSSQII